MVRPTLPPSVRGAPSRRFVFLSLMAALLAIIASGCALFPEERADSAPALPEPPQTSVAVTYPVERMDLLQEIRGTAQATSTRDTELYFLEGGRLEHLTAEVNQTVEEGELLASLSSGDLQLQLEMAEIDLEIARTRLERLEGSGTPPLDVRVARLELRKQEIYTENLRERFEAATLRAPFDGVVVRVRGRVSEMVEAYAPIVEVSDPQSIELRMDVNQADFDRIVTGQEARVEVESGRWLPATVIQTTHQSPRTDVTVLRDVRTAHLALDEDYDLRMTNRFSARIVVERRRDTRVIPGAALRDFRGRTYVRVLDGEVRREVDVGVGIRTDTRVEILDGLEEGQLVIGR